MFKLVNTNTRNGVTVRKECREKELPRTPLRGGEGRDCILGQKDHGQSQRYKNRNTVYDRYICLEYEYCYAT